MRSSPPATAPVDPRLAAAVNFLKQADVNGTYALGCRSLVWATVGRRDKDAKEMAKRDRDLILKNQRTDDRCKPFFRYLPDNLGDTGSDTAPAQFAVLGSGPPSRPAPRSPRLVEGDRGRLAEAPGDAGGWAYSNTFSRPCPRRRR
jgi:hypothetical protein